MPLFHSARSRNQSIRENVNKLRARRSAVRQAAQTMIEQLETRTLLSVALQNGVLTVAGTGGDDQITIAVDAGDSTLLDVTVNGVVAATPAANVGQIQVNALAGNDVLTVDDSNGNPIPAGGIVYDGGDGFDSLVVAGSASGNTAYTPGPGGGSFSLTSGNVTGTITAINIEPVQDNVPSATTTVNATNSDDAINYTQGPGGGIFTGNTGLVSVNNLETYEFNNKADLIINGLAGSDSINLNNPTTPTGLATITIDGGDPTASGDTLIVNGAGAIGYTPTVPAAGVVTVAANPTVTFSNIESLNVVGDAAGDTLTLGGSENLFVQFMPGDTSDSGSLTMEFGYAGPSATPLSFSNLGFSGGLMVPGRGFGSLDINGLTQASTFTLSSAGVVQIFKPIGAVPETLPITTTDAAVRFIGHSGNDLFSVPGDHPFVFALQVQGAAGANVLNFTGTGPAISVDLAGQSVDQAGSVAVQYTGIADVNIDADGGTVTITGKTGNDSVVTTPTGASSATLQDYAGGAPAPMTATGPAFNFTDVSTAAGGFSINGNGGSDQLFVEGTQSADTIDVNDGASGSNAVKVNALLAVNYNATMPQVEVDALAGSDTISIAPSLATAFLVDGGAPIGATLGDVINLFHPATFYQITPGPTDDSGGLNSGSSFQAISWTHIETVVNSGGAPIITGTNGDDQISIIARDSSYNPISPGMPNPLLDGIQDFTVSVNDGPDMLFVNTPDLLVDSRAGTDNVDVQESAPSQAAWNVQVWVAGGTSGAAGDTLALETPGAQDVTYTPDVAAPALAGVTFGASSPTGTAQFNDTTDTSTITAVSSFVIPGFYQSSPGGVEQFVYQGDSGNDALSISPGASTEVSYTAGATADAGSVTFSGEFSGGTSLVPLQFSNLGSGGSVAISNLGGAVDFNSPNAATAFNVAPTGIVQMFKTLGVSVAESLPVMTTATAVRLIGHSGNDIFNVPGSQPFAFALQVQGAAGNDTLNFTGDGTADVTVGLDAGNVDEAGFGEVEFVGVEVVNVNAGGAAVTVTGDGADSMAVTPTGASAATLTDAGVNSVFNFSNITTAADGFTIDPLGGANAVTVNGNSINDSIVAASTAGTTTTVQVNALQTISLVTADTPALTINALDGNDNLTVDSSNGPVTIPVTYDGGVGFNALTLTGGVATADSYTPGLQPGSGANALTFAGGTETISFVNLSPIFDDVVGPLTVNGTSANNAINYSAGHDSPANFLSDTENANWGEVSIDSDEPIEFTNKVTLTLNGVSGNDTTSLDNPNTPTALTSITANGGSGSDTLVANAFFTAVTSANVSPGSLALTGQPPVTYTNTEYVKIINALDSINVTPVAISGQEGKALSNITVGTFTGGAVGAVAGDFKATINWGDGTTSTGTVSGSAGSFTVKGSHTYKEEGTYLPVVTVTDPKTVYSSLVSNVYVTVYYTAPLSAPIDDTANISDPNVVASAISSPVVTIAPNASTGTLKLATFTDPGGAEALADYSATINWGDGHTSSGTISVSSGTFTVSGSHTYTTASTYSPQITIYHESSTPQVVTDTNRVVVISPSTIVASGTTFTGQEGRVLTATVATFTLGNTSLGVSAFSATINWGDGTTSSGTVVKDSAGHFHVTGSHAYPEEVPYPVTVTIKETGGFAGTAHSTAKISDSPLDQLGAKTIREPLGEANLTNVVVGTFRDQNSLEKDPATYTGTINWGDGHTTTATFVYTSSTYNVGSYWQIKGSHKYTAKGTFTVTITFHDLGGPLVNSVIKSTIVIS